MKDQTLLPDTELNYDRSGSVSASRWGLTVPDQSKLWEGLPSKREVSTGEQKSPPQELQICTTEPPSTQRSLSIRRMLVNHDSLPDGTDKIPLGDERIARQMAVQILQGAAMNGGAQRNVGRAQGFHIAFG